MGFGLIFPNRQLKIFEFTSLWFRLLRTCSGVLRFGIKWGIGIYLPRILSRPPRCLRSFAIAQTTLLFFFVYRSSLKPATKSVSHASCAAASLADGWSVPSTGISARGTDPPVLPIIIAIILPPPGAEHWLYNLSLHSPSSIITVLLSCDLK